MNILSGIAGAICLYFAVAWFHDACYQQGYNAAWEELKAAEQEWWKEAEQAVDEVRKQIWRETPKKGMWL